MRASVCAQRDKGLFVEARAGGWARGWWHRSLHGLRSSVVVGRVAAAAGTTLPWSRARAASAGRHDHTSPAGGAGGRSLEEEDVDEE